MKYTLLLARPKSWDAPDKFVGTYSNLEEAVEAAKQSAARVWTAVSFEVWEGTPKKPIRAVQGKKFRGKV